jgi:branched-chain amino acid transport system substrate-binding protein
MNVRFRGLHGVIAILALASMVIAGCAPAAPTEVAPTQPPAPAEATAPSAPAEPTAAPQLPPKEELTFGTAVQLSGWAVGDAELAHVQPYRLWVEQVNAKGGLCVAGYDKPIPIRLIEYDSESDIAKTVSLTEKLILEDQVDFVLPPWATAFTFAVAPIINKYGYPMIGTTESSSQLLAAAKAGQVPYYFGMWNPAEVVAPAVMGLVNEVGAKSAAVIFVGTLYGIDQSAILTRLLAANGIDVRLIESYPLGVTDLSPLLKKIKELNPDALLAISYPQDALLIQEQLAVIGFNPPLFYNSLSGYPQQRDKTGADAVQGMTSEGAWNRDFSPGSAEFYDAFEAAYSREPAWDTAITWASLQMLEEVICQVGLDREAQREYLATNTFDTIYGKVKFTDQYNLPVGDPEGANPPVLGQWQDGVFQVIWPADLRSTPLIFPKPDWPQ